MTEFDKLYPKPDHIYNSAVRNKMRKCWIDALKWVINFPLTDFNTEEFWDKIEHEISELEKE